MSDKKNNKSFKSNAKDESETNKKLPFVVVIIISALTYKYVAPIVNTKFDSLFSKIAQKGITKNEGRSEILYNQIDGYTPLYNSVLSPKHPQKSKSSIEDDNNDNHANQLNPNNDAYWLSRGYDERPKDWEDLMQEEDEETKANLDNYSNQLNPNNDAYWQSRGYDERPDNWREESTK